VEVAEMTLHNREKELAEEGKAVEVRVNEVENTRS
jgi:hypothetical protein